LKKKYQ